MHYSLLQSVELYVGYGEKVYFIALCKVGGLPYRLTWLKSKCLPLCTCL
jgi:hypothetical protein